MHKCLTYFLVYSEEIINTNEIIKSLEIDESVISKITEQSIEIGRCEQYDVNINNMVRYTIKELLGKEETLLMLKEKHNLEYYLSKVMVVDDMCDEPTPILGLEADVIEFLYKTKTIDDIDYYV